MITNKDILIKSGAEKTHYRAGELIFEEGKLPIYYFQIISGRVKLNNYDETGREFIQGIFSKGESFGESTLFTDFNYPINAITMWETTVFRLSRKKFLNLMIEFPELSLTFTKSMAERLYFKYVMLFNNTCNPSKKLMGLLNYFKSVHSKKEPFAYEIPFTRQQIADFTGLRVETVVRTIKKLYEERLLSIKNGKIYI